jgi:hypothetical protein
MCGGRGGARRRALHFELRCCTTYAETVHPAAELRGDHRLATLENTRSACRHCHGVVDAPRSQGSP